MGKKIVGAILGLGMMGLAVGAFLSNEPASKTDQGHIVILVVFVMGLSVLVNGLTAKPKASPSPVIPSSPVSGPTCPSCHKPISTDFAVCPYCATVLKPKCPQCGKEVAPDFKNCPYCGTHLH